MSFTVCTACGTAARTGSDRPIPALTSTGSQATTRLRPGLPPSEASSAKIASGVRSCASMTGLVSESASGTSTSRTVTVPGGSPRAAASTRTNKSHPSSRS